MTTADQYRAKAAQSAQLARQSGSSEDASAFARSERAYIMLAENADWMAANADKLVRPAVAVQAV
jgi:hypothetical protein